VRRFVAHETVPTAKLFRTCLSRGGHDALNPHLTSISCTMSLHRATTLPSPSYHSPAHPQPSHLLHLRTINNPSKTHSSLFVVIHLIPNLHPLTRAACVEEVKRHGGVERLRKVLMCDDEEAVDIAASIMASCSGSTAGWEHGGSGDVLQAQCMTKYKHLAVTHTCRGLLAGLLAVMHTTLSLSWHHAAPSCSISILLSSNGMWRLVYWRFINPDAASLYTER
jgi:hypothetical protein